MSNPPLDIVATLEYPGITLRTGYAAWDAKGRLLMRNAPQAAMWKRKPAYFRFNETGKFYAVESRNVTEEIPAAAVRWSGADAPRGGALPRTRGKHRL